MIKTQVYTITQQLNSLETTLILKSNQMPLLSLYCLCFYLEIINQKLVEGWVSVKVDQETFIVSNFNP